MINGATGVATDAPAFAGAAQGRIASSTGWLRDRRQAAWDAFTAMPMPSSQRDEDWRRTDIGKLKLPLFHDGEPVEDSLVAAIRERRDRATPTAALVVDAAPGTHIEQNDQLAAAGIVVTSLEDAVRVHPALVERALTSVGVAESPFIALWNAMWKGGVFIYVPRSIDASVPTALR